MFDNSAWSFVDPLSLTQAACLWAEVDPSSNWQFTPTLKSRVEPWFELLAGGFRSGEFSADPLVAFPHLGNFKDCRISREELRAFAEKRKLYPPFLFDTLPPNESLVEDKSELPPQANFKSKGGRPREYDWDAMNGELLRVSDLDGLPGKQADMVAQLQEWFVHHFDKEPDEREIEKRVSLFYQWRRKADYMHMKKPRT